MLGYNGLELVVYGAVELGDVVLFFVGEQGLFGLEVYARLVGQTDGVCDTGILATGLYEITVGLFGHLWHCVSPLLCSNTSTEQVDVYSRFSVMIGVRLHLTGHTIRHGRHGGPGAQASEQNDKNGN